MIGLGLGILTALLHAATAWRYGYFRDELYFIACSKHLAWGYVDQPPLVALAAWFAAPTGYALPALRALPVAAAGVTVLLVCGMVRELGGGRFAQLLAGVATALTPAYLLLGNTLTTTSFEPLSWTLVVYACIKIVRAKPDRRTWWWLMLAASIAFGAYGKYSIALLVVALGIGLALTPQRRALASYSVAYATGFVLLVLSPNLAWQAAHGWPFLAVLHGDQTHRHALQAGFALEYRSIASNALAFLAEQIIYMNPLAAPVWVAGVLAPFFMARMKDLRFVSLAYVALLSIAIASAAKGYYVAGIYASLLAIGAVAVERAAFALRVALAATLIALGIAAMPLSLPVLSVNELIAYSRALGLTGRLGTPPRLIQPVFAEEFGWRRLARDVAGVYRSLPPAVRTRTAIYADTYGDAGALDFFGPRYGLPPAISSQNTYYLWGTRGYDGTTLIAIGATRIARLRRYYRKVTLVRTSYEPLKWIVEGPAPIYLCRDPLMPLAKIWPHLRWYGA